MIERSEAVNLAQNLMDGVLMPHQVSDKGVITLYQSVLEMDASLKEWEPKREHWQPKEPAAQQSRNLASDSKLASGVGQVSPGSNAGSAVAAASYAHGDWRPDKSEPEKSPHKTWIEAYYAERMSWYKGEYYRMRQVSQAQNKGLRRLAAKVKRTAGAPTAAHEDVIAAGCKALVSSWMWLEDKLGGVAMPPEPMEKAYAVMAKASAPDISAMIDQHPAGKPRGAIKKLLTAAVEAQRNDTRTEAEKIRDGVDFIMGLRGDEGTRMKLSPSAAEGATPETDDIERSARWFNVNTLVVEAFICREIELQRNALAADNKALKLRTEALKVAFRVNILRLQPAITHVEIDAALEAILKGAK